MPFRDGTGPMGMGPMTGWAMGYCAKFTTPGYMKPYYGKTYVGFGSARGRGNRYWYYATGLPGWLRFSGVSSKPVININSIYEEFTPEKEVEVLKNESEFLKKNLNDINNRIIELEKIIKKEEK